MQIHLMNGTTDTTIKRFIEPETYKNMLFENGEASESSTKQKSISYCVIKL